MEEIENLFLELLDFGLSIANGTEQKELSIEKRGENKILSF